MKHFQSYFRYLFPILSLVLGLFVFGSCGEEEAIEIDVENELIIPDSGYEFKLNQRKQIVLPSIQGGVYCEIDDITSDQCNMWIIADSNVLLKEPIREDDTIIFKFNRQVYGVTCIVLLNHLIGDDHGIFNIFKVPKNKQVVAAKIDTLASENEKIETLLKKIERSDLIFIRNGLEYRAQDAADHLRDKWNQGRDQIKTYDDFITYIASRSSISGQPYQVKLKDGSLVLAKTWYHEQMEAENSK